MIEEFGFALKKWEGCAGIYRQRQQREEWKRWRGKLVVKIESRKIY